MISRKYTQSLATSYQSTQDLYTTIPADILHKINVE